MPESTYSPSYLTNQFLIAMPGLADPNFSHSVTYICEHNADGAMGVVINQPLEMRVAQLLQYAGIELVAQDAGRNPVYCGGPVEGERGFVLHRPAEQQAWESTLAISDEIALTVSADLLEAMAQGRGPADSLVVLGYAGWGAGQLEQELAENAWLNGPCDADILFHTPYRRRWKAAAATLGVDLALLSTDIGHA
ncbi:MAG: YqgE/AlgH family protein [Gammaproteobacteria bacterium]|nr:YqgE/AlgH family protein [Gammaproteobacteria bacterium]